MARLPAIPFDPSGHHRASAFLAESGQIAAQGDAALGAGLGRGLGLLSAGITAGKERKERRAERNAMLEERRADRRQAESHFQTSRDDRAREMAFQAEVASLDDNEALLRKMAEPFEAEFASLYMGATPEAMADPDYASRITNAQGQLKRLYEGIGSIRAQRQAMVGEARTRLRGPGTPVSGGRFQMDLSPPSLPVAAPARAGAVPTAPSAASTPLAQASAKVEALEIEVEQARKKNPFGLGVRIAAGKLGAAKAELAAMKAGEEQRALRQQKAALRPGYRQTLVAGGMSEAEADVYLAGWEADDKAAVTAPSSIAYRERTADRGDEGLALRQENARLRQEREQQKDAEVEKAREITRRDSAIRTMRGIMKPPTEENVPRKGESAEAWKARRDAGHQQRIQALRNMGDDLAVAYEALGDDPQNAAARAMIVEAARGIPQRATAPSVGGSPEVEVIDMVRGPNGWQRKVP